MASSSVFFYSKTGDSSISKAVHDALAPTGIAVQNIDSFGEMVFSSNLVSCYVLIDVTDDFGDVPKLMLNKLFRAGMIERIIYIVKPNSRLNSYYKIVYDSQFAQNLENFFTKIEEERLLRHSVLSHSWKKIIGKKLCSWGLSYRHRGFSFIMEALIYYLMHRGFQVNLRKDIYPYIEKIYGLSASAIELAIRKSILYASKTQDFPFDYVPSNKEFLRFAYNEFFETLHLTNNVKVSNG
ncbi:MAG: sporulation initiation factor Spo0A C-terminal domain-containing protein [Christensenellales bacterium]